MVLGMSAAHQRAAVTAGQANERSENTNPLTKSHCVTFLRGSLLPLQQFSPFKCPQRDQNKCCRAQEREENSVLTIIIK